MPETPVHSPVPVLLDCDPGVDDALALAVLALHRGVELVGVTTVCGNTAAADGAVNALRLLELAGCRDVPVAVGAADHLTAPYQCHVQAIHGRDGLGEAADAVLPQAVRAAEPRSAIELIDRLSREHAGRLEIVAVGPLTNLALALRADPSLTGRVRRVTIMGGAALAPGNVTPSAEANIHDDPEAAAIVLAADWDTVLVGLDVTMGQVLGAEHWQALADSARPLTRALAAISDRYMDFYTGVFGRRCSALHDPLAAALVAGMVEASVAPAVPVSVDTTDGPCRGRTIVDLRGRYRWPGLRIGGGAAGTGAGAGWGAEAADDVPGARCRVVLGVDRPLAPELVALLTA